MKHFVIYDATGRVTRFGQCQDETLELQAQDNEYLLEAEFVGNQYVMDGQLVEMPTQPSPDHIFDYNSKQWVVDIDGVTAKVYFQRNQLLASGPDRISPIWWAAMTPAQQQAWTQYRQDLLDIPQQPGFPLNVEFPVLPS